MVTKEIQTGARTTKGGSAPAVDAGAGSEELGDKFRELLHKVLGTGGGQAIRSTVNEVMVVPEIATPPVELKETRAPEEKVEVDEKNTEEVVDEEPEEEVQVRQEEKNPDEVEQVVAPQTVASKPTEATEKIVQVAVTKSNESRQVVEMAKDEANGQFEKQGQTGEKFELHQDAQQLVKKSNEGKGRPEVVQAQGEEQPAVSSTEAANPQGTKASSKVALGVKNADENGPKAELRESLARQTDSSEEPVATVGVQGGTATHVENEDGKKGASQVALQGAAFRTFETNEGAAARATRSSQGVGAVEGTGLFGQIPLEKGAVAKAKAAMNGGNAASKNQEKIVEQVKEMLKKAVQNREGNTLTVRVDPPELGQVTVKVTQREKQLFARIIPDSPDVERILRERSEEVTQVLTAAGLRPDQVHVSIGKERTEGETMQFQEFIGTDGSEEKEREFTEGNNAQQESGESFSFWKESLSEVMGDEGWVA